MELLIAKLSADVNFEISIWTGHFGTALAPVANLQRKSCYILSTSYENSLTFPLCKYQNKKQESTLKWSPNEELPCGDDFSQML